MPDQQLVRALNHPLRVSLLKFLAERNTICVSDALSQLNPDEVPLSTVAYHAWVLEHLGLIEPTGETGETGSPLFRATHKGEAALMALGFPP